MLPHADQILPKFHSPNLKFSSSVMQYIFPVNSACVWLATVDCVECTFLQMRPQFHYFAMNLQNSTMCRHSTLHSKFCNFLCKFVRNIFLFDYICRVTVATITETSVDLRVTCPLFCPIIAGTATAGQISLLFPIWNFLYSRTADSRGIAFVQKDKRINQFNHLALEMDKN